MGSQTLPKIPFIDLSKETLNHGTTSWFSACNDIRLALEEYGIFEFVYDDFSMETLDTLYTCLNDLFDLPTETKMKNTSPKPFHAYNGGRVRLIPIYDSLGIDDAANVDNIKGFTSLMWPSGNDPFSESTEWYTKLGTSLDKMVTRMVFESYGLGEKHEAYTATTTYLLRFFKYRVPLNGESNLGVTAHTDKTSTSIIHQNQINGLEIELKNGDWINYEPSSPFSFVFFAGEALRALSNGRIHAPNHKVVMRSNKARYSLGLFSFRTVKVSPAEELVDEEHPLKYKPFDNLDLLHFLSSDAGGALDPRVVLDVYCGV